MRVNGVFVVPVHQEKLPFPFQAGGPSIRDTIFSFEQVYLTISFIMIEIYLYPILKYFHYIQRWILLIFKFNFSTLPVFFFQSLFVLWKYVKVIYSHTRTLTVIVSLKKINIGKYVTCHVPKVQQMNPISLGMLVRPAKHICRIHLVREYGFACYTGQERASRKVWEFLWFFRPH